ncbi:FAD-dependent oxidoreductase [Chitinophaga nivalis]|uniref:NAD(P)-binding domain-containing protein n=1 Tax=Chitinophaga nivalis TaxID=2991709 RepID=A0ABT3IPR9_9BACT|nr:FAD-dependent oxidoreductase [Chitinophaga nivalis]MCW3464524.1 NAD(P)-binding domain-containing protein [Chitinophaga nivalis]MCW3485785.1 NAD(P)-binding domain-containing protein [Chitinophaga nivalis]
MKNIPDVIVIGGGHAGLSISYHLQQQQISHMVLERGQIGESWHSQRWDSFTLNTPNWMNLLPGETADSYTDPDAFLSRQAFLRKLQQYVQRYRLPVHTGCNVTRVHPLPEGLFHVQYQHMRITCEVVCRQLVIASGMMSRGQTQDTTFFPPAITPYHAATYRHPAQLPAGNVLVIGSGQSGCQITEELAAAGKKVFLATSKVGRSPRWYKGRDMMHWMVQTGYMDMPTAAVQDSNMLHARQPQVSGIGAYGHTISLQWLHGKGVAIMGKFTGADATQLYFDQQAAAHVHYADERSALMKQMADHYIASQALPDATILPDEADLPDPGAACVDGRTALHIGDENITAVIRTTGFDTDFSWLQLPILNAQGQLIHTNGITPLPGIYALGFPWLRKRKSGIIYGIAEDAAFIAGEILKNRS